MKGVSLFDLEAALQSWAGAMAKSSKVDHRQQEEMLDHLRLSAESLIQAGLTPESAFSAAVAEFGQSNEIVAEYADRARMLSVVNVVGALIWAGVILASSGFGYDATNWLVLGWVATVLLPSSLCQERLRRRLDPGTSELGSHRHG